VICLVYRELAKPCLLACRAGTVFGGGGEEVFVNDMFVKDVFVRGASISSLLQHKVSR